LRAVLKVYKNMSLIDDSFKSEAISKLKTARLIDDNFKSEAISKLKTARLLM